MIISNLIEKMKVREKVEKFFKMFYGIDDAYNVGGVCYIEAGNCHERNGL